jgi:hypothetical protein
LGISLGTGSVAVVAAGTAAVVVVQTNARKTSVTSEIMARFVCFSFMKISPARFKSSYYDSNF